LPAARRLLARQLVSERKPGPRGRREFRITRSGRNELKNIDQHLDAALLEQVGDMESVLRLAAIALHAGRQECSSASPAGCSFRIRPASWSGAETSVGIIRAGWSGVAVSRNLIALRRRSATGTGGQPAFSSFRSPEGPVRQKGCPSIANQSSPLALGCSKRHATALDTLAGPYPSLAPFQHGPDPLGLRPTGLPTSCVCTLQSCSA
jgi:hypothetical protein